MLFDVLAEEASQQSTSEEEGEKPYEEIIPFVKRGFTLEDVGVEEPEDFMQNYLVRYGITKETLIVLSVMVLILASATVFCALTVFVNQHRPEIGIIRSLGASARKMKLDLLAKVLSWSLISSALGIFLAAAVLVVFERIGYLQVLSHRISFQFDPLLFVVNFAFTSMLVVVGIGRASVKE
jgi:ABC-type lipoprotein release transport system permease subunit